MSEIEYEDWLTRPDGTKIRMATLKAQLTHQIKSSQKNFLDKLPEKKKKEFYYRVYEILQAHDNAGNREPFIQMGLSPYTFLNEPLRVGNFQSTYGAVFAHLHQALNEAEGSFDLGEK